MIDRMFMDMKMGPISVPKCFLVSIVTWQSKGRTNVCRNLYIDCPDICENYHVAVAINSSLKLASCGAFSFFLYWLQRHDLADHTLLLIMAPMDEMCVFGDSAFFSLYDKSALSS